MKSIVACFLLVCLAGPAAARDHVTLGSANGAIAAVCEAVLREAYRRIGVEVRTATVPPGQSLVESDRGTIDGELGRIAGLEARYPNLLRVPVPIVTVDAIVFSRDASFEVKGWDSLRPYRIGILAGVKFAADGTRGMQVTPETSVRGLFADLEAGRIEVAVATRIEGILMMRELKTQRVNLLEPPLDKIVLYHYLNARRRELLPKLTVALRAMEKEGRIVFIRQRTLSQMLEQISSRREASQTQSRPQVN